MWQHMPQHYLCPFMNQMFEVKTISYDLRNANVLFQPKWQKVTYGKKHFQKLWNSYMEFIAQWNKDMHRYR